MKWIYAFLVVLLVPMSAQAEEPILTSKLQSTWFQSWKEYGSSLSQVTLKGSQAVDHVRVSVFFKKERLTPDAGPIQQGRCLLVINQKAVPDMRKYIFYSEEGPELRLPHLGQDEEVLIGIVWKKEKKTIGTLNINVATAEESYYRAWTLGGSNVWFSGRWAHWAKTDDTFSFDDVCESYTLEAAKEWYTAHAPKG
jgi:hypothetical protein